MEVNVRLFAILRERAGTSHLGLSVPEGATVADAVAKLKAGDEIGSTLRRATFVVAVNRDYSDDGRVLAEGDEVALIPPVSGGAPQSHVLVTRRSLHADHLTRLVGDPASGAIVTFQGVTREIAALDYEAYVEMAQEKIAEIVDQAVVRHELSKAAVEHRTGRVSLGEPSVIVAVSAPHREQAFLGASEIIDRIKAETPIWKREVSGAGGADFEPGVLPSTNS